MKRIPLTNSELFALIDDEDHPIISQYKWSLSNVYGKYYARMVNQEKDNILMHRFLLNAPKGTMIDHRNSQGLDNRRCNIRFCTPSQNSANSQVPVNSLTGLKGVTFHLCKCHWKTPWRANIFPNGKTISLGLYETAQEAAMTYNRAAIKFFGEFANLNEI